MHIYLYIYNRTYKNESIFSYRHSLSGREAAAHLKGWTSDNYPNLLRRCAPRASDDCRCVTFSVISSFVPQKEEQQPGGS